MWNKGNIIVLIINCKKFITQILFYLKKKYKRLKELDIKQKAKCQNPAGQVYKPKTMSDKISPNSFTHPNPLTLIKIKLTQLLVGLNRYQPN